MVPLWGLLMAAVSERPICKEQCVCWFVLGGSLCKMQPQSETDKGVSRLGSGEVTACSPTKSQAEGVGDRIPASG